MRSTPIVVLASIAVLGIAPAADASGSHRHHRRGHHRLGSRVRLEHLRTAPGASGTTTTMTPTGTPGPAGSAATGIPTATVATPMMTVASFADNLLTVRLADGGTVSGRVTTDTRLECGAAIENETGEPAESAQPAGIERSHGGENGGNDGASSGGNPDPSVSGHDGGDESGTACTTAALVSGATVAQAELELGGQGAVWKDIELQ